VDRETRFFQQYLRHFLVGCADLRETQHPCFAVRSTQPTNGIFLFWRRNLSKKPGFLTCP
jgi:hypothetical protein